MLRMMYGICNTVGWNSGRTFPFEKLYQKNDSLRWANIDILRLLSTRHEGFNFLDEEWDYAIVLDACRYDVFKEMSQMNGKLQKRISPGSHTTEWIKKNITKKYSDTVLITANPQLSKPKLKEYTGRGKRFYKNIPAWDIGWDKNLNTTPPWTMLEIAKKRIQKFRGKRILLWFIQPHQPFIEYAEKSVGNANKKNIWHSVKSGDVEVQEAWKAYEKNLEIALTHVKELLDYLSGKIIITSDHGNCFGEMGVFEHPKGVYIPPLTDVPYLELEK